MYFKPPFKPDMDFYYSNIVLNGILLSDSCLSKRNKGMYKFNQSIKFTGQGWLVMQCYQICSFLSPPCLILFYFFGYFISTFWV